MNFFLGIIGTSVLAVTIFGFALLRILQLAFKEGRKKGWKEGYAAGHESGENWWLKAELEVVEAQHKLWREEA